MWIYPRMVHANRINFFFVCLRFGVDIVYLKLLPCHFMRVCRMPIELIFGSDDFG